jgi:hypothetical protein
VEFTQYDTPVEDFHPEILGTIFNDDNLLTLLCNQLSEEEQKKVASACKRLHDFMHQHYFDTTYGKALSFMKYMGNELNEITKDVGNYNKEQKSLFFTYKRMPLFAQIGIPLAYIFGAGLLLGALFFSIGNPLKFFRAIGQLVFLAVSIAIVHQVVVQRFSQQPLDAVSLNSLEKIRDKSPLLEFLLTRDKMTSLTQNAINLFLQRITNDIKRAFSEFETYHKSLIGQSEVPQVELDQVGEEKHQRILKFLLDTWNETRTETGNQVSYSSGLALT